MTEIWPIFLIVTTIAIVFILVRSLRQRSRHVVYLLAMFFVASAAQIIPRIDDFVGKLFTVGIHYGMFWFVYLMYKLGPKFPRKNTDFEIIKKIEKESVISRAFIRYGHVPVILFMTGLVVILALQGKWP